MACIARRRGKWLVDYRVGGRRCTPSFSTKGEAEFFLRDLRLRKIDSLTGFSPIKEAFLATAIDEYIAAVTSKKSVRTKEVDVIALDELAKAFPRAVVQDITSKEMELYQAQLLRRLQPATVNRRFNTIRHFFGKCVGWKYTFESPTASLKRVSEPPVERETLDAADISKLMDAVPNWAKDPLLLISMTSVRRNEAIDLEWKRVDLGQRIMTFFSKKGGVQRRKDIPMTPLVFEMLMRRWNERQRSAQKSEHVFTGFDGRKINPRTFSGAVCKEGRKRSGVIHAGIQILRRTTLTDLSELNQSGSIIQKIAGHSSLTTTQRYLHHGTDVMRSALDELEQRRINEVSDKKSGSGGS